MSRWAWKYSAFDGGTRVPFIVRWPGRVAPGESDALTSQIDLFASMAALANQAIGPNAAPDTRDALATLLGQRAEDREFVIEHAANGALSLIVGDWKYIEPTRVPGLYPHRIGERPRTPALQPGPGFS